MLALFAVLFVGMMIIPAYAESSPREQLKNGIPINQIQCSEKKTLIQSPVGKPACVFDPTLERLLVRGWSIIQLVEPTPEPQGISDITEPLEKPAEPLEKPAEPLEKPAEPLEKPAEPLEKPAEPLEKPAEPLEKPAEPLEKPAEPLEKPAEPLDTPQIKSSAESSPENGIMYLESDGSRTLKYAPQLPDPDAMWFPMSLADAEIIMQRMVKANDDKIIFMNLPTSSLPCLTSGQCRIPEEGINMLRPSLENTEIYVYYTEKGGTFELIKEDTNPDTSFDIGAPYAVGAIVYHLPEHISYDQREAFITSFMDKSGFYNSDISNSFKGAVVYGGIQIVYVDDWIGIDNQPSTRISFSGWTNNAESLYSSALSGAELERRAHEFAKKRIHLIAPELCESFMPFSLGAHGGIEFVYGGIGFYTIKAGTCIGTNGYWNPVLVDIEVQEGEIAFFQHPWMLSENWYEN